MKHMGVVCYTYRGKTKKKKRIRQENIIKHKKTVSYLPKRKRITGIVKPAITNTENTKVITKIKIK